MCQPSDAGLTSIILKIEAPCSVADVKKPAVISGQRTMPGSRSTRSACDSTMPTTLWSLSRSSSLPPLRIERKSGPVGISPASSYTCKASTGHAIKPRTIAIVAPVLAVEGHKLGTAERPGKFIAERFLARSRALDAQRREGRHRRLCELARQGVRLRRHAARPVAGGVGNPRGPPVRARGP